MKIYAISGLGADERVFQHLKLDYEVVPLLWIRPEWNESLEHYAMRLAQKIDTTEDYALMGLSFGGLVATEISKQLSPVLTILISSVDVGTDLRLPYRLAGKTGLVNLVPTRFMSPPKLISNWLFGAEDKELLHKIIADSDLYFAKWAVKKLITWQNKTRLQNCLKINGDKDLLIPYRPESNSIKIAGGHHFMIVDRAAEVSELINKEIKKACQNKSVDKL
jgi:hypothetical protein